MTLLTLVPLLHVSYGPSARLRAPQDDTFVEGYTPHSDLDGPSVALPT